MKPRSNQLIQTKPAEIRQTPELYQLFKTTFEKEFGYKPACTCSFFSDLQKLRNKLISKINQTILNS